MEEALRESEEKYRLLIETTDDFVFALDPEAKFIFGNAKAIETFGDLRGKPFTIPVPPEYHDLVKKNFARRIKGEKVEPYPIEVIDKKGNRFWVEVSGSPLIKDGKIIGAIYFEKDITERKKAEDRLVRLNKTFLGLGPDFDKNINLLTKACGELLGATCALYNRLEGNLLCSVGQWQVPKDYNPTDKPEGHICYDVIKRGREGGTYIVRNLPKTPYFQTDPNVARYGLITYVGYPVSCMEKPVGSLCVVYQKDVKFDENDERILEIAASAIGIEEDRKRAEEALRRSHNLLATISRAQSHFIRDTDPHVLFDKLLSDILSLTQSEYGFIGEVLNTAKGEPYLKTNAITNIAWNEETRALYEKYAPNMEFYNMKTLFGAVITTGKPVIANNPSTDPRRGGLPKGHPPLNAFLGLPFYSGKRLVGMAGVANRPGGYDEGLVEYLQPLLTTCGNIIEAYHTDQLRKRAEEETKKTRDYLQTIITSMNDGVLVINKDYVITDANQVAAEMVECRREKMVGRHCYEVIRGESQPCKPPVVCELGEVLKTGEPARVTHTLIDSRGGKHIVEVVASPIKDEKGEVKQIVDIARDITKEIEAEDALRESKANLNRAQAVAHIGSWHLDINKNKLTWSDEIYRTFGVPRGMPLTYEAFLSYVHPGDREFVDRSWNAAMKGAPYDIEHRIVVRGEVKWVRERAELEFDKSGKAIRGIGTVQDITERKRAEEARAFLANITEHATDAIVGLDLDTNIVSWNRGAEMLFGYSTQEIIGKPWSLVVPEEAREACRERFKKATLEGFTKTAETMRIAKGGGRFPAEMTLTALKDEKGEHIGFVSITRDITERKKMEEELKKRLAELERMHKAFVGRELKMKELKEETKKLKEKLGER